ALPGLPHHASLRATLYRAYRVLIAAVLRMAAPYRRHPRGSGPRVVDTTRRGPIAKGAANRRAARVARRSAGGGGPRSRADPTARRRRARTSLREWLASGRTVLARRGGRVAVEPVRHGVGKGRPPTPG